MILRFSSFLMLYSRHRLISPLWASHFCAYYPGEFYVDLFNKMSREKLGLLTGWAYYLVLFNKMSREKQGLLSSWAY